MRRSITVRLLTTLVILGLCAPTVSRGWEIASFWKAANSDLDPDGDRAEAVRPWLAEAGVAFFAREASLTGLDDSGDQTLAVKRREELEQMLTLRPLLAERWVSLFEMRLITAERSNKVLEAWGLSVLTGPNEEYPMSQRGFLGLSHWEMLPKEIQKRAASDLVARPLSDRRTRNLRKIVSVKPEEVRHDMRNVLRAEGFLPRSPR